MKDICLATQHDLFCVFVTAARMSCRLLGNYGTQRLGGPSKSDVYRGWGRSRPQGRLVRELSGEREGTNSQRHLLDVVCGRFFTSVGRTGVLNCGHLTFGIWNFCSASPSSHSDHSSQPRRRLVRRLSHIERVLFYCFLRTAMVCQLQFTQPTTNLNSV